MKACLFAALALLQWVTTAYSAEKASPVVARVGSYSITKEDVAYRAKVITLDTPEIKGDYALKQLIKYFTYAQILTEQNVPVTDDVLQKESERIDSHTLLPEKLAELKGVFGFNQKAYLRLFVLPTYVERVIYYEFFAVNPAVHANAKRAPREFLQDALKRPADFEALAKRMGHVVSHFTVTEKDGVKPEIDSVPAQFADGAMRPSITVPVNITEHMKDTAGRETAHQGNRWITEVVPSLKTGDVYPRLMEFQETWLVVRYLGVPRPDTYRFAGVNFPKANFDEWLERQKKKVKVVLMPPKSA